MEGKTSKNFKLSTRQITVIGLLSSISIILGMTPLGIIPIPPMNATIMHIPVIIGAILEGPIIGALIGLIFGVFSMVRAITTPNITSFIFLNPLISVLPRVAIGITSYYCYKAVPLKKETLKIGFSAIVGSLTNTIGVLGLIYLFYLKPFAVATKVSLAASKEVIWGIAVLQGIPEAILSVLITVSVVMAVRKLRK